MISISKIIKILSSPREFLSYFELTGLYSLLPDNMYLKLKYWIKTGRRLNINNPKGFCEKLQWLKLHDRNPLYTTLVDKYKVREYIASTIGEQFLIPLLGAWQSPDDIDFSTLPNQFVLKCNHNSGEGMCICKNKAELDIPSVRMKLKKAMSHGYYNVNRQWPYKNVKRRIICEKYMKDDNVLKIPNCRIDEGMIDYKFYCFNGVPKFLYVGCACIDKDGKHDRLSFYNLDWTKANFYRNDHPALDAENLKPQNLSDMIDICYKLSKNIPFVRIDLYNIEGHIYFSEFTFFPGGGLGLFVPHEYEIEIGNLIQI